MNKSRSIAAAMLLLSGTTCGAADKFPLAGGWGFNWLRPQSARCKEISAQDAERLRDCRFSREFSFGLDTDTYACKVDKRTEYLVFRSKKDCREAFETMQANAP